VVRPVGASGVLLAACLLLPLHAFTSTRLLTVTTAFLHDVQSLLARVVVWPMGALTC
jgi:hypothetical protein